MKTPPWLLTFIYYFLYLSVLIIYPTILAFNFIGSPLGNYDESIQLVGGMLLQHGSKAYSDYFLFYMPLNYYLNYLMFELFGYSVLSARILQILLYFVLIIAVTLYFIKRPRLSVLASSATLLAVIIIIGNSFRLCYWNSYVFGFIGLLFYLRGLNKPEKRNLLYSISGLLVGICCLGKINFGIYFAFGIVMAICREIWFSWRMLEQKGEIKRIIIGLAYFCAFFILPLFLFIIIYRNNLREVFEHSIIFPMHIMSHAAIPLKLENFQFVWIGLLPFLWIGIRSGLLAINQSKLTLAISSLFILLLGLLLIAIGKKAPDLWAEFSLLITLLIFLAGCLSKRLKQDEFVVLLIYYNFLHYLFSRADDYHFAAFTPLVALLLVMLVREIGNQALSKIQAQLLAIIVITVIPWILVPSGIQFSLFYFMVMALLLVVLNNDLRTRWLDKIRTQLFAFTAITFVPVILLLTGVIDISFFPVRVSPASTLAGFQLLQQYSEPLLRQGDSGYVMSARLPLSGPVARLFSNQNQLRAIQVVHNNTHNDDSIYIGATDHAKATTGSISAYWLSGRRIGVSYFLLSPGFTTEETVQTKMIDDIQRNSVNWIILADNSGLAVNDQPDEQTYGGSPVLDQFIRSRFETICKFGSYSVLKRRDLVQSIDCDLNTD